MLSYYISFVKDNVKYLMDVLLRYIKFICLWLLAKNILEIRLCITFSALKKVVNAFIWPLVFPPL